MRDAIIRALAAAVQAGAAQLDKNELLWTWTIPGFDGSPYLTRTLGPRLFGYRLLLHQIHREDTDEWMHNHPWGTAKFMILSGGYVEQRLGASGAVVTRELLPGDVNEINAETFHRVTSVQPNTWTLGIVGERVQDWGFLVRGKLVLWRDYFAQRGHTTGAGAGSS